MNKNNNSNKDHIMRPFMNILSQTPIKYLTPATVQVIAVNHVASWVGHLVQDSLKAFKPNVTGGLSIRG